MLDDQVSGELLKAFKCEFESKQLCKLIIGYSFWRWIDGGIWPSSLYFISKNILIQSPDFRAKVLQNAEHV